MDKIIIADIEPIQRQSLKMLLEERLNNKVKIFETDTGEEVVKIVQSNSIDLVIMDAKLISMSGVTCAKKLKELNPIQKIVVLTMQDDVKTKREFVHIGVSKFLAKPLRPKIFIEEINEIIEKDALERKRRSNSKIDMVLDYIDQNLKSEDLNLLSTAEKMGISSYYLSKIFKKEMGINFVNYINLRKIELAKDLLKNNDIPIVNISFELGFAEPSYFTKVFKKVENMTPTQYRNQFTVWN